MRFDTRYEKVEDVNGYKYVRLKSGRRVGFHDAEKEASLYHTHLIRWMYRMMRLATTNHEYDWDDIERLVDRLEALCTYYRIEIEKHTKRKSKEERIAQLRNVTGRTEDEAAAFLAKADALEAEL